MPSSFVTELHVRLLDDGRWILVEPFSYEIGDKGSGILISVPAGFVTDFASVPRILRWLIDTVGTHGKAAVLHDYLYSRGVPTRLIADAVFLEAMGVLGVPCLRRWLMFHGVRCGGWYAWRKHRRSRP